LANWWSGFVVAGAALLAAPLPAQTITAADDAYSTEPAIPLTVPAVIGVLANDSGGNEAAYTAVLNSTVTNGALLLDANGGFFYLPNLGFTGNDTFTYVVNDGTTTSAPATVTITVATTPGNVAPVAVDDSYAGAEDAALDVPAATGVLANDTDTEPGPLTAVLLESVSTGNLAFRANGSFTYTPTPGFVGSVEFRYRARDGAGAMSAPALVTLQINQTNDAPVAAADSYSTAEDQTLNVGANLGVLGNDTDPENDALTAVLIDAATSGTLTLQPNGSFDFVPAAGFSGTVTFTYQADDGAVRSNTATVTITVNAVNDAPTANADTYTTAEDTALAVNVANGVLANDTDPDAGTTLTAALVASVATSAGTLTLRDDGSFNYTPAPNFSGAATFTYQARDGSASSANATVTINVAAANDAPFITNAPPKTATEGMTYGYTLTATDPDGNALQITAPTLPAWLRFTAPATITGTPAQSDAGLHDVVMEVSDGIAPAVVLRFEITVQTVDNAPTVTAIPEQTATEGSPFDFDLAKFVTDPDTPAGSITYAATGGLPPGMTVSGTGRLSGTPTLGNSVGRYTVQFDVADATNRVPGQLVLNVLTAGRIDLAVTLSAAPNPVPLDAVATWTIAIANRAANVAAPGVSLDAAFNGDVPFPFDAVTTAGCTATPSGNQTALTCTLGPLAAGATTTITLSGRGGFAGDVFGRATVAATGGAIDEVPGNDRAEASLSIAQRISSSPEQRIEGLSARAIAAADLNGDGFDDLAVATASTQGVVLLMNGVDPTSSVRRLLGPTPQSLGGEALGTDLVIVDLDRDNDLDIVLAAAAGAPDRTFVAAGGAFTTAALGAASLDSRAVAAGDINGDAFVDLVFANPGGSSVLMNSGSGAVFTAGPRIGTGDARDVLLVDLLGDALPELVIANGDGDAAVYANAGGVFTFARTLSTGPTSSVASGDFNADTRADLVFGRETAAPPGVPAAPVMLNQSGSSLFLSDELGAAATSRVLARDFDLDGNADVLASSSPVQRIFTNAGAGSGTFVLHPQELATPGARAVAAGKLSNDDRVDLVVAGDAGIAIFVNDGKGNFGSGDSTPPTLTLRGEPTINITIDTPFTDPGATATDAVDGDLSSRIVTSGSVNNALLGSYTLTYTVTDLSGNAATPVTRTVNVQAQPAADEGGGGATGLELVLALLAGLLARVRRARSAPRPLLSAR
jgi:VCBS repeat-containing protein